MHRDYHIDWLRAIGLILIMLAHVVAPFTVTQLRCFDVPLMVFVSGICYKSYKGTYCEYIWKRFKRLYFPTCIFLSFYCVLCGVSSWLGVKIPYTFSQILGSFLLQESPSIGYVWIIRIFLLMAFVAPLIYKLADSKKLASILSIIAIFILDIFLVRLSDHIDNPIFAYCYVELFLYVVGYGIMLYIGMIANKLDKFTVAIVCGVAFIVLVTAYFIIGDRSYAPGLYKYPPHSYFICYGIICSLLLWSLPSLQLKNKDSIVNRAITFIGINSLWIYLWHIPFVTFMNYIAVLDDLWYVKWTVAICGASMVTYYQKCIINKQRKISLYKYLN